MAGYPVLEAHSFNALLFDNVSQYLTTTSCPATDSKYVFSGDFTIEAWINFTVLPATSAWKAIIQSEPPVGQFGKSFWFGVANINNQYYLQFFWSTDGINWLNTSSGGHNVTGLIPVGTVNVPYNFQTATWYHVVASRNGNNYNVFINGVLVGQYIAASAVSNFAGPTPITIGFDSLGYFFNGYISNLRIVKGIAVYNSPTSGTTYFANSTVSYTNPNPDNTRSFIPPIVNLNATQSSGSGINAIGGNSTVNTSLLVCQNTSSGTYTQAFLDNSSYAQKLNNVGYTPTVSRLTSPSLPYPGYFSTSFSGATQALSTAIAANTSWAMGQGDFTVEAWVYINTLAVNTGIISAWAGSLAAPTANACCFSLTTGTGNAANVRFTVSNTSVATGYESTIGGLTTGTWNHVAAVRIANTLNIYTNGVKTYAGTAAAETTNINCANAVCVIGAVSTTNSFINAYISNARVTKAVGAYSNTFTPYLYPLANSLTSNTGLTNYNTIATGVAGTSGVQLLACRYRTLTPENSINGYALTSTGVPVVSANVVPQYVPTDNNLLSIATQPKSPTEPSNTAVIVAANANFNLGTGAFTIEGWFYPQNFPNGPTFISSSPTGGGSLGQWALSITATTGFVTFNYDGGAAITTTTANLVANAWSHVAITRSAVGVYTIFVNGTVATGTATSSAQFGNTTNDIWVGAIQSTGPTNWHIGYSNNIRITRGIAVYTGAFTPPSANLGTTQSAGTNIAAIPLAANVGLLLQANSTTGAVYDTSPTNATVSFLGNYLSNTSGVSNITTNSVYTTVNNLKTSQYKQPTSASNPLFTVRKLNILQPRISSAELNTSKTSTTVDTINTRKNSILLNQVSVKALLPYFKQYTAAPDIPVVIRKPPPLTDSFASIELNTSKAATTIDAVTARKLQNLQPVTSGIDKTIINSGTITLVNDQYPTTLYKQLTTSQQFWS